MFDSVVAGIGGMVGMAGALGYGFKLLVDVVSRQLGVQNIVIRKLESGMTVDLRQHIADCRVCQTRHAELAKVGKAAHLG